MSYSDVEIPTNGNQQLQQEKIPNLYAYNKEREDRSTSPTLNEKETPLLIKILSSLPFLLAFPIIFLSHELSLQIRGDLDTLPNSILLTIFVSATFVGFLLLTNWLAIIPINNVPDTLIVDSAKSKVSNTLYLLTSVFIILTPTAFIPAGRLAVLLLALFQNPWNLYTPVSLVVDCVISWQDSWTTLFPVICSYLLVVVGFFLINRKLHSISISELLSNMEKSIIVGVVIISGAALSLYNPQQLSYSMMVVNVATIFVTIISLSQFQMRDSFISPLFVSIFSIILEYIVIEMSPSPVHIVNMVLTFLIKPDSSLQWTNVKANSKPRSPILKELVGHSDTRAIFNFLLLNASFMFVQFLYSFRSKSLGLLSDSLHMALDCMSLAIGLVAGVIAKHEIDPNGKYPFGLRNFEILAGFTNGSLLVGISGTIMFEAIGRLLNPVHLQKTNELIVVSVMGLLVNLVGIFAFNHGHAHGHGHSHGNSHGHSHSHAHAPAVESEHKHEHEHKNEHEHNHSHETQHSHSHSHPHDDEHMNDNMRGIFLHIMADALGSVGVVISTILTKLFDWQGFDPISSIIIAMTIFVSAVPLIKSTASTLLLQITKTREDKIRNVLREISEIRGVRSFASPRFWPNSSNSISGYIHIQIYRGENGSFIKKQCEKIFKNADIDVMFQIENDYDDCWCRK